jgi:acetyl esterase/lipase
MKYFLQSLGLMALAGLLATSCQKAPVTTGTTVAESVMMDVKYGADAKQAMDVYLPANRSSSETKTIIFIHGGSWSGGDKADFNEAVSAIKPQLTGYAIFNLNYRLAGNGLNRHPAQMEDIQAAINFITSKASEYKINTSSIGLIGASAGAHLALLQGYKNNNDGRIKAIVDLFGPTNLTTLYNNHPIPQASQPVLVNFLGTTPAVNSAIYFETSPFNYVTSASPATLILHGDADFVVPIDQSQTLKTKLQANNVKVDMKVYAGEGHGWVGANLVDTYTRAVTFIKENVR